MRKRGRNLEGCSFQAESSAEIDATVAPWSLIRGRVLGWKPGNGSWGAATPGEKWRKELATARCAKELCAKERVSLGVRVSLVVCPVAVPLVDLQQRT